jgi:hypothetical protein
MLYAECTSVPRPTKKSPPGLKLQAGKVQVLSIASLTFHHQYWNLPFHIPFQAHPTTSPRRYLKSRLLSVSSSLLLVLSTRTIGASYYVFCNCRPRVLPASSSRSNRQARVVHSTSLPTPSFPAGPTTSNSAIPRTRRRDLAVHRSTCTRIAAKEALGGRSQSRPGVCTTP